jgi:hypothetical protein
MNFDFFRVAERVGKNEVIELYPEFRVVRSKDLMIRAKSFYAIWDEGTQLWSTDEYDVQRLVDEILWKAKEEYEAKAPEKRFKLRLMGNFSSGIWKDFRNYMSHLTDSFHQLDEKLVFSNTVTKKTDYISRRLPYALEEGDWSSYDELMGVLYSPEERAKLEWALGAIISGDSKHIQKFLVLYGPPGSGKGTWINLVTEMFPGYYATFDAKALGQSSNSFATEVFRSNPLIAIQHDGDLSKIEDNSRLNSIFSHEMMTMNEKFKPSYDARVNAFAIMGTNKPVKITDAKSGIIRRLIDVNPTGNHIPSRRYATLISQMSFELGAIAHHCLEVYRDMGKNYFKDYRPVEMMLQTDVFYNFIEAYYDIFAKQNGATLTQAYTLYKTFAQETELEYKMPQFRFREELRNYFDTFEERAVVDNVRVRSWYGGFLTEKFKLQIEDEPIFSLALDEDISLLDELLANQPAQYSKENGTPQKYWTNASVMRNGEEYIPKKSEVVSTILSDLTTTDEHYVKPPENHIVIDFDLTGEDGKKSAQLNLEAASKWPPTYAEYSKSGAGIHLHYDYTGDATELSRVYGPGIEIKVFTGNSSLRRRLSKCNNVPVAPIHGGLPLKEKKVISVETIQDEKHLRVMLEKNLRKEIHTSTKPSIDFIDKLLKDAYASGMEYDVTDLRGRMLALANNSTNHAIDCIKLVQRMPFASEPRDPAGGQAGTGIALVKPTEDRVVIFDVEVFPNLFMICWKYEGSDSIVTMINPSAQAVEELFRFKLVGYNNRRYDNHMLWAAYMGYSPEQIYRASKKIIDKQPGAYFGEAYEVSYTDIFDFASRKESLKWWEIELGLPHKELGIPWDEPVDPSLWGLIAEYCQNDVNATDEVWRHLKQDFVARQILAELSGLSLNASTLQHTAKIIFGNNRKASEEFVYTNLAHEFPGYEFELGKSSYRGEDPSEGGYVYSEPGMYTDVVVLDVESMHPTSMGELEIFGPYTNRYMDILEARLAIKHKDYDKAKSLLNGALSPYLQSVDDAKKLSYALKIVINIVYGLTSAKFDNPFRDKRNVDNIVAKRGALFMIELKHAVQEQGYKVVHIKTDSIKIPDATPEIIQFVHEFGERYGYRFEHEESFSRFALVNNAVYIGRIGWHAEDAKKVGTWEAVGAQFQQPYVYKTLFSKENIEFADLCQAKFVTGALYLDCNTDEALTGIELLKKELTKNSKKQDAVANLELREVLKSPLIWEDERFAAVREYDLEKLEFIGKAGKFCPVQNGGGVLLREKNGKYAAATGTKGYRWTESASVEAAGTFEDIDKRYFDRLVNDAVAEIAQYGDFEWFTEQI